MFKKIRSLSGVFVAVAAFTVMPLQTKASCNAPFTGEFILCASQEEQFWSEVEQNCGGVIIGPVSVIILGEC